MEGTRKTGSVLVVGGGIAGMQASLDLANSGFKVYLVEHKSAIGGKMAQLDKTFPTNDCAMCTISPRLVEVGTHSNIEIITNADLEDLEGEPGNFTARIRKRARYVDEDKCTGCGTCVANCPVQNAPYFDLKVGAVKLPDLELACVARILEKYSNRKEFLVSILQDIDAEIGHLPEAGLRHVSQKLDVPLSRIYNVATFYTAFSLQPRGRHRISVCLGTACHVRGAPKLLESLERELRIRAGETTADRLFSLQAVRCLGCCGLAPVITVNEDVFAKVRQTGIAKIIEKYRAMEAVPRRARADSREAPRRRRYADVGRLDSSGLVELRKRTREALDLERSTATATVTVHMGTCGNAAGAGKIHEALLRALEDKGLRDVIVRTSGCAGLCSREPMATVEMKGKPPVMYAELTEERTMRIVDEHLGSGRPVTDLALKMGDEKGIDFFSRQKLIALRNRGLIDPESIEEYIARDGYDALARVLTSMKPEEVIAEIKKSGLRGRGGAGFPTGAKWEICRSHAKGKGESAYVICNGDEGDPGAYMDRSIVESDPHSVLEGMIIGAYAIGAAHGYAYIRNEYPLAVASISHAIDKAREAGLLGKDILGSGFEFDVTIQRGAGAFVCGEETSLIASLEGRPPEPRQRPPFPAESGVWGKPTNINNVETWATVPSIIREGAEWFRSIGTEKSKGTKVFSLVGKVKNTGLVEVPMGITLEEIIFTIGGGIIGDKKFKAVQTGGPSGGCIPASLIGLPIDYERLAEAGSIMGSGGMIVMDEDTCMVDVARYFLDFLKDESCGKCLSCREGILAMHAILQDICDGKGRLSDLATLEELAQVVRDTSQCGLGKTASNPVLSTLKHFRNEYEAHIKERKCPAGVCRELITYSVVEGKCKGCTLCARNCPSQAVTGETKKPHRIDPAKCIKCGACHEVCRFDAVKRG